MHIVMQAAKSSLLIMFALLLLLPVMAEESEIRDAIEEAPAAGGISSDIVVVKTSPDTAALGAEFDVTITVTNRAAASVDLAVREAIVGADVVGDSPVYFDVPAGVLGARPPELRWDLQLAPGATETIMYTLRTRTAGLLSIGPTVLDTSDGERFFSNDVHVTVGCREDSVCDEDLGETPMTCVADCAVQTKQTVPPPRDAQGTLPSIAGGYRDTVIVGLIFVLFIGGFIAWLVLRRKKDR